MFYICADDSDRQNIFDQIETTNHIMIVNIYVEGVINILLTIILSNL